MSKERSMKLLRVDSSARASSVSRQLTERFVEAWRKENPEGNVQERDLSAISPPHITDDWSATFGDPSNMNSSQREYLSTSDALIEELLEADTILIGAPMHNFTIPWELKAWIDQVVRLGKTVAYGANGPQGLLTGKKVVIATSRGGSYGPGTPRFDSDFQEPYLRRILAFIGLTDVMFIHAENQYRREQAEPARAAALERIDQTVAETSTARNRTAL
jgi:FMN-dependent NADH-azoreductase